MSLVNRKPRKAIEEPAKTEEPRVMPVISPDKYLQPTYQDGITVEEKRKFLELYYESGNESKAAKQLIAPVQE